MLKYLLASAALVGGATTAHAATFTFQSMLDAAQSTTGTTSTATGMASISVDDDDETIDFSLSVDGLSLDGLNDAFVDGANAALGDKKGSPTCGPFFCGMVIRQLLHGPQNALWPEQKIPATCTGRGSFHVVLSKGTP